MNTSRRLYGVGDIAKKLHVTQSCVSNWLGKYEDTPTPDFHRPVYWRGGANKGGFSRNDYFWLNTDSWVKWYEEFLERELEERAKAILKMRNALNPVMSQDDSS